MIRITVLLITAFFFTNQPNSTSDLSGKWLMHKVIQNGQDVTAEHNPHNERYIILKEDGSFESGGRPYGKNTGKYVFDSDKHTLFLDSDVGPNDDSQWYVNIKNDTMHWQGYGSEWAEDFQIIQIRSKR